MKLSTPLWLARRFKNAVLDRLVPLKTIEIQGLTFYYLRSDSPPHDANALSISKLEFHHKVGGLSGEVAIDVGANLGSYAVRLARQFRTVIAFEPDPAISHVLRLNVATNKLRNVIVREVALSDRSGTISLYMRRGGATSLNASHYGLRHYNATTVQVMRLDDLPEPQDRLDFLKIDAEGSELSVLRGGRKMIEKFMPIIGVEVHCPSKVSEADCTCETCAYLRGCGYVLETTGQLTSPTSVHWVWATPRHV